jgi:hypothetical protein
MKVRARRKGDSPGEDRSYFHAFAILAEYTDGIEKRIAELEGWRKACDGAAAAAIAELKADETDLGNLSP